MKLQKRYFFGALLWAAVADIANNLGANHFEAVSSLIATVLILCGFVIPVLVESIWPPICSHMKRSRK